VSCILVKYITEEAARVIETNVLPN
jgi:hypothetical protein